MTLAHGRLSSHKIFKISPVQSLTKSPREKFLPSKDGPTLFVIKRGTQQKTFPRKQAGGPGSHFRRGEGGQGGGQGSNPLKLKTFQITKTKLSAYLRESEVVSTLSMFFVWLLLFVMQI